MTGSHEKRISRVLPFRHQLNGVPISIFSSSAPRRGRLSFRFFFSSSSPRNWPQNFQTLDCNRTDNNPGSKPSLCLVTQRKHQPADYLVFALSTNTMQKETIGLPQQLFSRCLSFWLHCFFCHMQKEIGRGMMGGWWERGSQTKLKTEKKDHIEMIYVFGLWNAVKQQYILNLRIVWLYFVGRGNMATAAFFRDLRAWDWSFLFFIFHRHCWFPSPSSLSSCFRDDVVMFCEGTAHTSMENKHYSCFLFSVNFNVIVFILECVWRWY